MQASVPPQDPAALLGKFTSAAEARGFRSERFGEAGGYPLLALTKRTPGVKPRIYLSAGIHGDEPAAPLALLEVLEGGAFDGRAVWFLCPLLNPAGLRAGRRENRDGVDLNRDYRQLRSGEARAHVAWLKNQPNFDCSICLHEDWESTGFYLYERTIAGQEGVAATALRAAEKFLPIDLSALIDGFEAKAGIIRPEFDPARWELWPESMYLHIEHRTRLHYTLEAPSKVALELRVAALRAGTEAILKAII